LPRKSDIWLKTISGNGVRQADEISTKDMVSDLTYTKTTAFDGTHIDARWVLLVDHPDLKVMIERADSDSAISPFSDRAPMVITYRRKEDE